MENQEPDIQNPDGVIVENRMIENRTIENRELLVMTVEIGDGRQDIIAIREHDDPAELAKNFSDKHGLDASLQQSLTGLILENKEIIKKKEQEAADAASVG